MSRCKFPILGTTNKRNRHLVCRVEHKTAAHDVRCCSGGLPTGKMHLNWINKQDETAAYSSTSARARALTCGVLIIGFMKATCR